MILLRLLLAVVALVLLGGVLVLLVARHRRRRVAREVLRDRQARTDFTRFERRPAELHEQLAAAEREAVEPTGAPPAHPFEWRVVWALGAWRAVPTWETNPEVHTRHLGADSGLPYIRGWLIERDERVRAEAIRVARA